jgi:hypothetical protein
MITDAAHLMVKANQLAFTRGQQMLAGRETDGQEGDYQR